MNTKDAFGVLVRITGLWILLYGLYSILWGHILNRMIVANGGFVGSWVLAQELIICAVGWLLLRWADGIAGYAYPDKTR